MQYASDQPKNVYMYMQLHGFFFGQKPNVGVKHVFKEKCLENNY